MTLSVKPGYLCEAIISCTYSSCPCVLPRWFVFLHKATYMSVRIKAVSVCMCDVISLTSVCWPICMHAKNKQNTHTHIDKERQRQLPPTSFPHPLTSPRDGDSINDLQCKQQLQQNRHFFIFFTFSFLILICNS